MADLHYINQGLFTVFIPISKAGEQAWNEMATVTDGTGKVLTMQAKDYIYQLRKAGYKVSKAPKVDTAKIDPDALLKELGID